jgi:choline dehydrogenase-like flavoprotein
MPTSLIIGSGPAAAGAALALARDPSQRVTVLDVGGGLEPERVAIRESLAATSEPFWSPDDVDVISRHAVAAESGALPEKRAYGSDFPFRDFGQLDGVGADPGANASVISGAYGGFSNVWGAQIMPFSRATFDGWPVSYSDMVPHYKVALDEMSLTAEEDGLAPTFPLLTAAHPLPELSERTRKVLSRYEANRGRLESLGVTVGRARLAMRSPECTNCGLCMTGCPYGLIYSASQTFDRLIATRRITYRRDMMALRLAEGKGGPTVTAKDLVTGELSRVSADRIFVACGGIGTTRLVLGSLEYFDRPVELGESVQFVMPALSLRATADPRTEHNFTLNQFNLVFDPGGVGYDLSQVHFYPYNPVFLSALPAVLQHRLARPLVSSLLRRLSVGLGYVPSWGSPRVEVVAHKSSDERLPDLHVGGSGSSGWPPMLRRLARTMVRIAPTLDLWPVLAKTTVSSSAKSYHFGGSFPHGRREGLGTDRLGRLGKWDNIHLVDASVFPTVPATTFTLTIMANAHRIASEVLSGPAS